MPSEPQLALQKTPIKLYWLATRPTFLGGSLIPALLGALAAHYQGFNLHWGLLLLTLLATALVHSAMNVLNDYYDEQNGTDRCNTERIFPFTGGSRFIQNQVLTAQQTLHFGLALLIVTILLGISLAAMSSWALLGIGVVGVLLGWGYSAPPLRLNSRGWGEPTVAVAFGLLTPLGAWLIQTETWSGYPLWVCVPVALLAMNILYMNQFPDFAADKASGKHHWVVRLGLAKAPYVYLASVSVALLVLLALSSFKLLPLAALWSALPLGLGFRASYLLLRSAQQPQNLTPAIQATIMTMMLHGLILCGVLGFAR